MSNWGIGHYSKRQRKVWNSALQHKNHPQRNAKKYNVLIICIIKEKKINVLEVLICTTLKQMIIANLTHIYSKYSLLSMLRWRWVAIRWRASLYSRCKPSLSNVGFCSTRCVISISILLPRTCDLCTKSHIFISKLQKKENIYWIF